MAKNVMKTPLLRLATRNFAAEAAAQPYPGACETKCTILPNKLIVASQETGSPISRVSIIFRAGSRNETADTLGSAHVLRSVAGLTTKNFTQFGIVRNIQQLGGSLSVTGDRETISYNLVVTRDKLADALPYLADVATQQVFKPWEVSDNIPRLKYDLSKIPPEARAVDILHKAAFRNGLGNSLFVRKDLIGSHNSENLCHYVSQLYTSGRASVVGVGVDQPQLCAFAQNLCLNTGEGGSAPSPYFGGEIRKDKKGNTANVVVAAEGVGLKDQKQALVYAVLQHALGVSPSVRWGTGASRLAKDAGCSSFSVAASALNINYSDTGLFGVFVSADAAEAGKAVEGAVKVLKSGSVSDADVKRGKAQLKAHILTSLENSENLVEDIGIQALLTGAIIPGNVYADAVDKITTSDVNAVAKKVAGSKLSLAAIGNLSNVPYLDQIK